MAVLLSGFDGGGDADEADEGGQSNGSRVIAPRAKAEVLDELVVLKVKAEAQLAAAEAKDAAEYGAKCLAPHIDVTKK